MGILLFGGTCSFGAYAHSANNWIKGLIMEPKYKWIRLQDKVIRIRNHIKLMNIYSRINPI